MWVIAVIQSVAAAWRSPEMGANVRLHLEPRARLRRPDHCHRHEPLDLGRTVAQPSAVVAAPAEGALVGGDGAGVGESSAQTAEVAAAGDGYRSRTTGDSTVPQLAERVGPP